MHGRFWIASSSSETQQCSFINAQHIVLVQLDIKSLQVLFESFPALCPWNRDNIFSLR